MPALPSRSSFLAAVALVALASACTQPRMVPAPTIETAAIQWLLFHHDSIGRRFHAPREILLDDSTTPDLIPDSLGGGELVRELKGIDSSLARSAFSTLRQVNPVESVPPGLPAPAVLLPHDSIVFIMRHQPMSLTERLKSRWLGPVVAVSVSAHALSADGTTAVVSVGVTWGFLDGQGCRLLLRRGSGGWSVIAHYDSWLS